MDLRLMRLIDRYAGVFLCRFFSALNTFHRPHGTPERIRTILVILLSEMGSLVLAKSMFQHLKVTCPEARIYVLVFKKNSALLEILGYVSPDEILVIRDTSALGFATDCLSVLQKLRRIGIDVAIDCELFARISSLLSYLSGAKIRVGFHRHTQEGLYRGGFINSPVLYNPYRHISDQFLMLVSSIDSHTFPRAKILPPTIMHDWTAMSFPEIEVQAMKLRLLNDFPVLRGRHMALIHPGGGILPIRAWPLDRYSAVAKTLVSEGCAVGVIGLKEDKPLAASIASTCSSPMLIDLTGYTETIKELLLLFECAALLITNDGGPGQFSVLTSISAIILFGPETPLLYAPRGANILSIYRPTPCSPCLTAYNHRNSPCDGDNQCLKAIHPKEIISSALKILEKHRKELGAKP
jgi:ADP-heptose:LPS heptosyltransferase